MKTFILLSAIALALPVFANGGPASLGDDNSLNQSTSNSPGITGTGEEAQDPKFNRAGLDTDDNYNDVQLQEDPEEVEYDADVMDNEEATDGEE